MMSDAFRKTLRNNDLGWLEEHWTAISIATDITTLSLDTLVGLVRNGRKGVKILEEAGHTDEAKLLSKRVDKAQEVLNELGDDYQRIQTKLAKQLSKEQDTFGNLEEVKLIEDFIRNEKEIEKAMAFDHNGRILTTLAEGKKIEKGVNAGKGASVNIEEMIKEARETIRARGGKQTDISITHNHILGSALSPSDILTAIQNNLKELRAVGPNGVTYSLKRKKMFPNSDDQKDILNKVNNIMDSKYPKLKEYQYVTGGGDVVKAQFYAETLLKKFEDHIEYTKFTN